MYAYQHDGVEMAYERAGHGPAVLFLHNGGTSHTIWRYQVEALSDRYCTVAVDLPGFGASPRPPSGIDLAGYRALIAAFVRDELTAPVVIVGQCMGANIAAGVAASEPDAIAGLVLVNPLTEATFAAGRLGVLHKMQRWTPVPSSLLRSASRKLVPPRLVAELVLRMQLGPAGVSSGLHRDPELIACNQRRDQLPALVDVLDDMDAYAELDHETADGLRVPIWTIYGERNKILSSDLGRGLGRTIGSAREDTLVSCGHLPMLEQPEEVTRIVEAFLAEHLPVATETTPTSPRGGAE